MHIGLGLSINSAKIKKLASAITFLLRDEFTTPDAAPITSPRTCEPGPGTLTIDDTAAYTENGNLTLPTSGKSAKLPSVIPPNVGQAAYWEGFFPSGTCNLAFSGNSQVAVSGANGRLFAQGIGVPTPGIVYYYFTPASSVVRVMFVTKSTLSDYYVFAKVDNGPWNLIAISTNFFSGSSIELKTISGGSSAIKISSKRIFQLNEQWAEESGYSTSYTASVSSGYTFTHAADTFIRFSLAAKPSSGSINIRFRIQDANNYWLLEITSAPVTNLYEVVSGSPTLRGTSSGTITEYPRWVTIAVVDEKIIVWWRWTWLFEYTSAANFKTSTDGSVSSLGTGGQISYFSTDSYSVSGAALTELEKYTGA